MARSSWNPNTPDVVGVEFLGAGVASHVIQSDTQMRALRFKPQRTGEVDQVAIYCGAQTSNPALTPTHFAGHRKPFIIELIPASGFDPGGVHTITTYQSAITASSNVIDEAGTAPEGDELAAPNDGLFLFNSGTSPSSMTVHMLLANTFPLDRHVLSIAVETNSFKSVNVRRIDQNGGFFWTRLISAGLHVGSGAWHMGEAYIENGTSPTWPWQLWTPQNVREFNSGVGNRRLRINALDTSGQIHDLLRMHVDHIPERRAGVGVFEPPGPEQWVMADLHLPNVTGSPAVVQQGQEYVVLIRVPGGHTDYVSANARYDHRALADLRSDGSFQHYTALDWDLRNVNTYEGGVPSTLGDVTDGLPALSLINNGSQTVDTQPYRDVIPCVPFKETDSRKLRQSISVPAGVTEYGFLRVNMSVFDAPGAPEDKKAVLVSVVNNVDTIIAGPFSVTEADVEAAPTAGTNIFGNVVKTVTVPFGVGIDINEAGGVNAKFTLHPDYGNDGNTNITWRVSCLLDDVNPVTGADQTAAIAATGHGFIPPTNAFLPVNVAGVRRGDLEVSLLSQAPEITGIGVTGLSQPVSGGACDPCDPDELTPCTVRSIPYHRICWSPTTLHGEDFGYYELQRQEHAITHLGDVADWVTIAIIAPTGTPVTGVPATGVPTCFDDWSHVYDSEVCYRVRQQRADGTLSDFVEEVCITTPSPTGADVIITSPDDPSINVAFPEAHGARLPIEHDWKILDADQHVLRSVYGRDGNIAFRPLEHLGVQFSRQLLISALCTPTVPCLHVIEGIHAICQAAVSSLVVRDRCGNRWYASVNVPSATQLHDPDVGDIWLATIEVTELATPVISPETTGVHGH